ncbi:MAG: MFS transporter [Inhella sp.]|uniref:MFS transporter n=1 Tax=Inhella sp. TaxID=1921806 RepID=UPI0022CC62A6|nr:MFS transporter [Inhella sp.]MCZ8233882.1 MFS transporter [Inhella sp.]
MTPAPTSPLRWVPTLYFAQGLQFFVVMLIAGLMFKSMGVGNDAIARWTGVLGLAWVFKPLWSPFLELLRSKKLVIVAMQFTGAIGLGLIALALQLPVWFGLTIALLFVLAYASATHDIAADGLYMASLSDRQQAAYAGWQGAFFNASKFLTLGGLLVLAGHLETRIGVFNAWSLIFVLLAVVLGALATYNARALPGTLNAGAGDLNAAAVARTLREVIADFLQKPGIWIAIVFIVLFRLAEGQVQTIGPLFLKEAREAGGLGLSTEQVGGIYGTAGTAAFLVGSILGGTFTAWLGLRRALPVLILAMAVPNVVFWALSVLRPTDLWTIGWAIGVEMAGYGFGFVGMILFIMQVVAPGRFQTAHYALGTGVMQLGFVISKTVSGDIQLAMGYQRFFLWTIACGVPALLMLFFLRWPKAEDDDAGAPSTRFLGEEAANPSAVK